MQNLIRVATAKLSELLQRATNLEDITNIINCLEKLYALQIRERDMEYKHSQQLNTTY